MKNVLLPYVFSLCFTHLSAQITVVASGSGSNEINVNSSYTQNFNALNSNGSTNFSNNSTLRAWYINSEHFDNNSNTYYSGAGTNSAGRVYSLGSSASSDCALGYVGSGTNDYFNLGFRLKNNSGSNLRSVTISFVGEQWRSGGNTNDNNNHLHFFYQVFSGAGSFPTNTNQGNWTQINSLSFTAPQKSVTVGALNGNMSANRKVVSTTIQVNVPNGNEIWFRWVGNDGSGFDAALGIDDFTITPSSTVPVTWLYQNPTRVRENLVKIEFATASEINNEKFEIQKNIEGESAFRTVKEMAGKGNFTGVTSYQFHDKVNNLQTNFYRIKQVDFDGKFSYTPVLVLQKQACEKLTFFPNPCKNKIYIHSSTPLSNALVFDSKGHLVASQKFSKNQELVLSQLKQGKYYINVFNKRGRLKELKVVKQ